MNQPHLLLPVIDWIVLLACIAGALLGASAGLARSFGLLLWALAALWLGDHLSAHVLTWMPNAVSGPDGVGAGRLQVAAFTLIALLVLALPVAGRIVGGASGKKKSEGAGSHKPFAALTGLVVTALVVTLLLPFMRRVPWVSAEWQQAKAPIAAEMIDANVAWLFPAAHREALRGDH
jgi:hypothetical protein